MTFGRFNLARFKTENNLIGMGLTKDEVAEVVRAVEVHLIPSLRNISDSISQIWQVAEILTAVGVEPEKMAGALQAVKEISMVTAIPLTTSANLLTGLYAKGYI